MFCRNCGKPIEQPGAIACLACGAQPLAGRSFCQHCGNATDPAAYVCVRCGVRLGAVPAAGERSRLAAGLFGIFLGGLGVHRFYLGYVGLGVLQIVLTFLTCGIAALWGFIEGILILAGEMNSDADGRPLGP